MPMNIKVKKTIAAIIRTNGDLWGAWLVHNYKAIRCKICDQFNLLLIPIQMASWMDGCWMLEDC